MGLGSMHVSTPDWRDWPWLINAFAVVLLTPGAAGEQLGYDRHLKTNTSETAHSFAVPSGTMLCQTHAEHDRFPPAATHQAVRPDTSSPTLFAQMFGAI